MKVAPVSAETVASGPPLAREMSRDVLPVTIVPESSRRQERSARK